ncbi:DUF4157 domain-containing protein [Amycolatopsis sp. WGS_07]|uniref:eCIS core domain-containing protein n=1 Tax=Amycolatopsis sp. WGS_07 TaxID=3076764 RepID=UPI003873A5C9
MAEHARQHRASPGKPVPGVVDEVLAQPGQSLDPRVRASLEPRFDQDFSQVRVHTDRSAAESADALAAEAYTVGDHIVFNAGRYAPGTSAGRSLIAHELTHVAQQSGLSGTARPVLGGPHDHAEHEAESFAAGTNRRPTAERAPVIRRQQTAAPKQQKLTQKQYDEQLAAKFEGMLAQGPAEGQKAVEDLNGYSMRDIAAVLRLMQAHGKLAELRKYASVRPLVEVASKAVDDPVSVADDDLTKVDPQRRLDFRLTFHTVENSFLPALESVCQDVGCRPLDLLSCMMSEGGVRADIVNPDSHAVGLIQFMPATLAGLGYPGTWQEFSQLSATEQMDYVRKFLMPGRGKFTSAGRVYQFMYLPKTMRAGQDADTVITTADNPDNELKRAYEKNAGLDTNKDGSITIGELDARARQHRGAAQRLLTTLQTRPKPQP